MMLYKRKLIHKNLILHRIKCCTSDGVCDKCLIFKDRIHNLKVCHICMDITEKTVGTKSETMEYIYYKREKYVTKKM